MSPYAGENAPQKRGRLPNFLYEGNREFRRHILQGRTNNPRGRKKAHRLYGGLLRSEELRQIRTRSRCDAGKVRSFDVERMKNPLPKSERDRNRYGKRILEPYEILREAEIIQRLSELQIRTGESHCVKMCPIGP